MPPSLDQAKALVAIKEAGTFEGAGKLLKKSFGSVMYLLKGLEEETGLQLLDRNAYRTKLTKNGELLLELCGDLLKTEEKIQSLCQNLKGGYEASLHLVYDGILDFSFLGPALKELRSFRSPTRLKISASYLNEVQSLFEKEKADFMVAVVKPTIEGLSSLSLPRFSSYLVAGNTHPLTQSKQKIKKSDLKEHELISIQDPDSHLGLSTTNSGLTSSFFVNDFASKKEALLLGLGYGWLPDYLIKNELKSGKLKILKTEIKNEHSFSPTLYYKEGDQLGKSGQRLKEIFSKRIPGHQRETT